MKEFKQTNRTEGSFSKGTGSICVVWRWVARKKGDLWPVKSRYCPVMRQGEDKKRRQQTAGETKKRGVKRTTINWQQYSREWGSCTGPGEKIIPSV